MPETKARVRLDIPEKDREELRVLAARSGLSMAAYCAAVVQEAIQKGRVVKVAKQGTGK